ncbi:MAG: hypothetical protein WC438_01940 [Candidatus Pacearchaeota archaeon]
MVRIAIEASENENGFNNVLKGAEFALSSNPSLRLILVAGEDRVFNNLKLPPNIELVRTKFTYDSKIKPNQKTSSIHKAIEMHKNNEVDAVISPGDTRGAVRFSYQLLGLMKNVLSPAIPTHWPRKNVMLDSGANPESKLNNLYQYAIMGHNFSKYYLGVESPLISIVTNGVERQKGSREAKKAKRLIDRLNERGFNIYEGFFEGTSYADLDRGIVGVIGGEEGNIALKIAETALMIPLKIMKEEFMKQGWLKKALGYWGVKTPLARLKQICDYRKYATAPLLGINGNVMICHGRSDSETIANAIKITDNYLKAGVNEHLREDMIQYGKV